jgi:hypothetical protein
MKAKILYLCIFIIFICNIENIAGFIIDFGVNIETQNKIELLIFGSTQT